MPVQGSHDADAREHRRATAGQVIGFNSPASVTLPRYAGIHTGTCIERVNSGGGTASIFSTNRLSVLRADWDG
jgi:hypothetical protein